jgi:ketosteroid isomerase-like protein
MRHWIAAALFWSTATAAAGCAAGTGARGAAVSDAEIARVLHQSAVDWNTGDLEGFLAPYLDSPEITFVGGDGVTRGKAAVEARYREVYWQGGRPEQTLRFGDLEVRPLGRDHALALGRYRLFDASGAQAAEGPFTLVFARTAEGWKIVHDHSS